MDFLFVVVPLIIMAGFVYVFGTIISRSVKHWSREKLNDASPRLTVPATVVTKREEIIRHRHDSTADMDRYYSSTRYYATFQFESGDRIELPMEGSQYGLLVEGDRGRLTFQGTRFLSFARG